MQRKVIGSNAVLNPKMSNSSHSNLEQQYEVEYFLTIPLIFGQNGLADLSALLPCNSTDILQITSAKSSNQLI